MKKIILILSLALISCKKDKDVEPVVTIQADPQQTENVAQYVGVWDYSPTICTAKQITIVEGSNLNEVIFDGIRGVVVDKELRVSNAFNSWVVTFTSDSHAVADLNGLCFGIMNKR